MDQELYKIVKEELKDFEKEKPTKSVENILNIIQNSDITSSNIEDTTQEIYIKLFLDYEKGDFNSARQSWVTASGNNFENIVRAVINRELNKKGILAIKGDKLRKNPKAKDLVDFITLHAKRRCVQKSTGVWPDSDILLITKEKDRPKIFALFSCKTSDHSRNDAVLFWANELRSKGIKYCLVTQDRDNVFVKGDKNPQISGMRKKCEAYLDRVYTTNKKTEECSQVVLIDLNNKDACEPLFRDITRWKEDIVPNSDDTPIEIEDIL